MRLIKIDPQSKTVETVESTGTLQDMYRILGCQFIDVTARQENGDSLTVDDDALSLDPQPAAFSFNGSGPIHGVALLTGTDAEGACAEPLMSVSGAQNLIDWLGEIYTPPSVFVLSW